MGKTVFLVDKNLPFGASISCSHFQHFFERLRHILEYLTGKYFFTTCYLDDFLFCEYSREACNSLVRSFLQICREINFPVALDKTEWTNTKMTFLGILVDAENHTLVVPEDKRVKALQIIRCICQKKKSTIKQLQSLARMLNFITKVVYLGRVFTRRMHAKFSFVSVYKKPVNMRHKKEQI